MEWVGRKVYEPLVHERGFQKSGEERNAGKVYEPLMHERGFQKSGEERNVELEVLETAEGGQLTA